MVSLSKQFKKIVSVILSFLFQQNPILVSDEKFQKEYAFTSNTDEKDELLCIFQVERGFKSTLLFNLTLLI